MIPGFGKSPGEGKGYPLQYSGLENFKDCIVHGVAKSWTRLSDFHFHFIIYATICVSVCVCLYVCFSMMLLWIVFTKLQKFISIPIFLVKVTQSCPTLCNPMDYTVHGILQARILEWVAVPFSRGSSQSRNQTGIFYIYCTGRQVLYH